MQLDIFEDSRDQMLRNDVILALERRDALAARAAWQALVDEYPGDASRAPLEVLADALAQQSAPSLPLTEHAAARSASDTLTGRIEPAARAVFGAGPAAGWLKPLWRDLAERAGPLEFRADHAEAHAAPLWLRAGEAAAAVAAVERIESWRRIPAPLAWMAEARHHAEGLEAAWPLLAELAWLAPARFDAVCCRLADSPLHKLRQRFDTDFDHAGQPADLAWFPAWALTEKPGLAQWLCHAQPGLQGEPEQGMRLMLELLSLERQGRHRDMVDRRRQLRSMPASLFDAYMRTR